MDSLAFDIKIPSTLTQFGITKEDIQNHVEEWLVLSLWVALRLECRPDSDSDKHTNWGRRRQTIGEIRQRTQS